MKRFLTLALMSWVAITSFACSASRKAQWDAPANATAIPASNESAEQLVAKGDEAWKNRGDRAALEAALVAWEQAAAKNPSDATTLAKLTRGYYFLADGHLRAQDKAEEYLATMEKSLAAGERSLVAANPQFKQHMTSGGTLDKGIKLVGMEGIDAMYWYAASLGRWARAKGFATQLANRDRITAVMQRAMELDPKYFYGAPHRYFGAVYAVAPSFAGGDMNKSKEHFEKSLEIAPQYVGTKVLMADVYAAKQKDQALFEKLLDEVLATPDDVLPGLEPEVRVEKAKANELKAKIPELF